MPEPSSQYLSGFLNIDKPPGITAHDVVARVRKRLRLKQVGHGGTLDPMATGVLPVAVGNATRLLRFLEGDKTYVAGVRFGMRTDTDDIEGKPLLEAAEGGALLAGAKPGVVPELALIKEGLRFFEGQFGQRPPAYSAVHVGGKRMYELARAGQAPDVVPMRDVTVHCLKILDWQPPVLTLKIKCSAGTYIRSIARDLGNMLGCGGCLQSLRREQAGPFRIEDSITLERLSESAEAGEAGSLLVSPQTAIALDTYNLTEEQAARLRHGQALALPAAALNRWLPEHVFAVHNGNLVAVCRRSPGEGGSFVKIQPEVVLSHANEAH